MPFQVEQVLEFVVLWATPFLRLSGMMVIAPIFSAAGFSVRVRVVLATLIAALITPVLPPPLVSDLFSPAGVLMAIRELGVGLAIGFVLQLAFGTAVYAGQAVSMTMGLGFAMSVDPQNGVQVPVLSQLYVILTTLLLLAIDGHLMLIRAVAESYQIIPAGMTGMPASSLWAVAALGSQVFAGGILLALPAMAALLMVNITFGVITRTAPQLNIFAVGFPMTMLGGFFVLFVTMPNFISALQNLLLEALAQTLLVLR